MLIGYRKHYFIVGGMSKTFIDIVRESGLCFVPLRLEVAHVYGIEICANGEFMYMYMFMVFMEEQMKVHGEGVLSPSQGHTFPKLNINLFRILLITAHSISTGSEPAKDG